MALQCPICKYPLGSGGNLVIIYPLVLKSWAFYIEIGFRASYIYLATNFLISYVFNNSSAS